MKFLKLSDIFKITIIEKEKTLIVLVFFITLLTLLVKLENTPLPHHDDLTHACIGKMILIHNDWITMHEGKDVSFLKPPLYFWLEAIFFKIFGVSDFWARFPSAVFGFLTIVFVYFFAVKVSNDFKCGIISVLIISSSYYFIKMSRSAMLDVPLAFINIVCLYYFFKYEFEGNKKSIYFFYFFLSLGYYIKAIQGIYPLFAVFVYYIFRLNIKKFFYLENILGILLFFMLVSFWFVPQYLRYGDLFLKSQSAFGPIIFGGLEGYNKPFFKPVINLIGLNFPWGIVLVFSIYGLLKEIFSNSNRRDKLILLLSFFIAPLIIISVSNIFYIRYLVPIVPIISVLNSIYVLKLIGNNEFKYRYFKLFLLSYLFLQFLFLAIKPISLQDGRGTEYYDMFKIIKFIPEIDKNNIVIYAEKYYKLNQGLSYYADVFPKRYVKDVEELLKTKDVKEVYVTNWKEFSKITDYKSIKIVASDFRKWVIFKFIN